MKVVPLRSAVRRLFEIGAGQPGRIMRAGEAAGTAGAGAAAAAEQHRENQDGELLMRSLPYAMPALGEVPQ